MKVLVSSLASVDPWLVRKIEHKRGIMSCSLSCNSSGSVIGTLAAASLDLQQNNNWLENYFQDIGYESDHKYHEIRSFPNLHRRQPVTMFSEKSKGFGTCLFRFSPPSLPVTPRWQQENLIPGLWDVYLSGGMSRTPSDWKTEIWWRKESVQQLIQPCSPVLCRQQLPDNQQNYHLLSSLIPENMFTVSESSKGSHDILTYLNRLA